MKKKAQSRARARGEPAGRTAPTRCARAWTASAKRSSWHSSSLGQLGSSLATRTYFAENIPMNPTSPLGRRWFKVLGQVTSVLPLSGQSSTPPPTSIPGSGRPAPKGLERPRWPKKGPMWPLKVQDCNQVGADHNQDDDDLVHGHDDDHEDHEHNGDDRDDREHHNDDHDDDGVCAEMVAAAAWGLSHRGFR